MAKMRQKWVLTVFLIFLVKFSFSQEETAPPLPPSALPLQGDPREFLENIPQNTQESNVEETPFIEEPIGDSIGEDRGDENLQLSRPARGSGSGQLGYYQCAGPEGLSGQCRPVATCANYYSTKDHYDYARQNYHKSCVYGYGNKGVCCPEVYYSGRKQYIIHYTSKKNYRHDHISSEAISKAAKYAQEAIDKGGYRKDLHLGRGETDPSYWGNGVTQEHYNERLKYKGDAAYFLMLMTEYLKKDYGYDPESYFTGGIKMLEYGHLLPSYVRNVCYEYYHHRKCHSSKYRSLDGSCNNLQYPWYGQVDTPLGRIIPAHYSDQVYGIRSSYDGSPLPDARKTRDYVLSDKHVAEKDVNTLYVNYGQFVVHDISGTPFWQADNGQFIDCCSGYRGGIEQVSPKCYAIPIGKDDHFYKHHKTDCLNLARTMLAPNYECALGYSSPLNHQSHFHDCSHIYSTNETDAGDLRTKRYGMLKMSKIGDDYLLPNGTKSECFESSASYCPDAGDGRCNLHPGLSFFHHSGVRLHNYCAKGIYRLNSHWDDQKIYEECRRIVIAIFQHLTYSEYLPMTLGWQFMYDYNLLPVSKGYSYDYDEYVKPWVLAEFTGAAGRHHSMVYGKLAIVDENYKPELLIGLENHYNSAKIWTTPNYYDKIARGLMWANKEKLDQYHHEAVSLHLLKNERKFGLDLGAMNLHRGNDFAFGGYNYYREVCGLPRAKNFETFYDTMDKSFVDKLRKMYKHPDDVSLYAGGLGERPVKDSLLGPTWWCISGYQFQTLKRGDRYYYENGGMSHSFSLAQLDQIKKMSMAAYMCITTGIKKVPAFAFRTISKGNPLISCDDYDQIPTINFGPWKATNKYKSHGHK